MIENCIFDFGNVLAEFDPLKLTAPYVADKDDVCRVSEVVFDRIYWDRLDKGNITDSEVIDGICSRLSGKLACAGCSSYKNWVHNLTPVPGMPELVEDLKRSGKRLYLLSNISKGFARTYSEVEWISNLLGLFDGVVLSGLIGKIKPDSGIFEYVMSTYNLNADECVFIDDSARNISGAEKLGIKGYLFDGDAEKLRDFMGI